MAGAEIVLAICLAIGSSPGGPSSLQVDTPVFRATITSGCLDSLETAKGEKLVQRSQTPSALTVHREGAESAATVTTGPDKLGAAPITLTHTGFAGPENAEAKTLVRVDAPTGDLILEPSVSSDTPGIWGLQWSIGRIPLDYAIIVPGHSGLRLTRHMPAELMQFDYPQSWEAQLVIVEGLAHGFYVWAEDPAGRYKRLVVRRHRDGWELSLITKNDAPFGELTSCRSVPWHVNTHEGDWREPARRYRDWAVSHFHPVPIQQQKPDWIREIRAMVIMGTDQGQLDILAKRLDPLQTVLYVPSWRAAGYDRDYPSYDQPVEDLGPFIRRAHALGFRVMLHVNYFGVDPKNPLYQKFEPYQVRDCFGSHDRQWWLWTRAEPEIRFAYINPALKAWRDLFTERMVELCRTHGVDALHLDQTLCIDNDHNGRIDGLSMLEGNLALHRQLREALPEVALSGEGLNEVTYRYEAFAQRHAYGLNHSEGTWDRQWLAMAHPISSFLFRPYTIINGYLGCASPAQGQFYAAWNEAYEHWGVIPTLKPQGIDLADPKGFARQFFDEVSFWQQQRLDIDLERDWPATVAFPFRTAGGQQVQRTIDGRLVCGEVTVSQTISGVGSAETDRSIPDWRAYDKRRAFGLDPVRWYPVVSAPWPLDQFHVCRLPEGMIARSIVALPDLAMVRTESSISVAADLVHLLETASGGSRPFQGAGYECPAPFVGSDGAVFQRDAGDRLFAHPPWKVPQTDPNTAASTTSGTGTAYLRYSLDLPKDGRLTFLTDVALRTTAVGQPNSDGVTFRVAARAGQLARTAQTHQATDGPVPLAIDLTELAGCRIDLELSVDPGPKRSPSFDWALWIRPRVEVDRSIRDTLSVTGGTPWPIGLDADGPVAVSGDASIHSLETSFPGTVYFLREQPKSIKLPCDLAAADRHVCFLDETGQEWLSPATAGAQPGESMVGGVSRHGLFAHPPDGGRTVVLLPMQLPPEPAVFRTGVGLRDGSKSTGVRFLVEVNGRQLASEMVVPGGWHDLEIDLTPWRDRSIVLSLITDSAGSYYFDWAHWGQPRLDTKSPGSQSQP